MTDFRWQYEQDNEPLALRLRPIREHWEARGPGMLAWIERSWPWIEFQPPLTIRLREPEGERTSQVLDRHTIDFVAYLANPWDQLPETVRLTWLSCCARAGAETDPWRASLIPLALESARFVELLHDVDSALEIAADAWLPEQGGSAITAVRDWWVAEGHRGFPDREAWRKSVAGALLN